MRETQGSSPAMGERLVRILTMVSARAGPEPGMESLCQVASELTATSGTGLLLASGEPSPRLTFATDEISSRLTDLELTMGEGPCRDAMTLDRPALEPDLSDPSPSPSGRWVAFAPAALALGARAIFAYPVRVGAAGFGAMGLYRDRPGPIADDAHEDALVMADVMARAILSLHHDRPSPDIISELGAEATLTSLVHQACGMISVQLGIDVGEALVRLRAYSYGQDRLMADVAEAVVSRSLRFDDTAGV